MKLELFLAQFKGGFTITVDEFIKQNPRFAKYSGSPTFKTVYAVVNDPNTVYHMIYANNNDDKSALEGAVVKLESLCGGCNDFDFKKPTVRQDIGRMVMMTLAPYGYVPDSKRDITSGKAKWFKTAKHYRYEPSMVKKRLRVWFEEETIAETDGSFDEENQASVQ